MDGPARYRFGEFELDTTRFRLLKDGAVVPIEPKALDLLRLLVERAPRIVEKAEIFAIVWKGVAVTDNALTRLVAQLRKALADDPKAPRYIETIATRGYRFLAPAIVVSDPVDDVSAGGSTAAGPAPARAVRPRARARAAAFSAAVLGAIALFGSWFLTAGADRPGARTAESTGISGLEILKRASLRPRELTTGTGFDGYLAYSPDSRSFAFASDRSGALEIYVQGLAPGSVEVPLTSNGRQNVQPVWSPDGSLIAYHEMAGNGVWVVPARGGVGRRVADFGAHPSWSPDGRRIAFQSLPLADVNPLRSPGALSTIWVVDADGRGEPAPLTRPGDPAGPHLAPIWRAGSEVLFVVPPTTAADGGTSLWTIDTASRQARRVIADERLSADVALAPNGEGLYFIARGTNSIWWLSFDESGESASTPQPTGLPAVASMSANLTISPDGRHLAWTAIDSTSHIWGVPAGSPTAAPAAAPLTEGVGIHYLFPAVSADGRIAMTGIRHGSPAGLFLLSPRAPLRQLTTDTAAHHGPRWMPGGQEIAFVGDHGGELAFWSVDAVTGRERRLFSLRDLPHPRGESQPSPANPAGNIALSPDFSRLAMAIVRGGVQNLWIASLDGGRPAGALVQRTFERGGASYPVWSPDGRAIAYQCTDRTDTHVCVVDAEDGTRVQVTNQAGQSWIGGWADNDTVLFAARREAIWNVSAVSQSTRVVRTLTRFTEPRIYVRYPRWDAAARRVLFERSETGGRIWSLDLTK
jgi:Tol biopolymer transport system component/DNA-binding winged helix-turn-helix (wHTH) protein